LVVDVDSVLDGVRFRGLPLRVLVCSAVVLALDGFDIQVIGFVAPALGSEFGVTRAALGPVLAASLVGMAIGGLGVGPVGDRVGRRAAVLLSTAIFAAGTLLGSVASSIETLAMWRLLTGIGLGGAMPNVTALMAEFAPPRWRSLTICAAIAGVPVGGMLGAALAAEIIPAFGWRAIFVVGGVLPLLWLTVMYFVLPESPRYLAARGNKPRELAALLNRIDELRSFSAADNFVLRDSAAAAGAVGVRALFSRELMRNTIASWVIFGTNIFAVYAIFNWAPVVLTSLGLDLPTAVRGLLLFNLAGVVGSLALSLLIPAHGSRWLLALCAIGASASAGWLAWLAHGAAQTPADLPVFALMCGLAFAGLTTIAIQVGMFPVMAHVYPVPSRASGVGWAIGLGRLGGILSSFAGGWFMTNMGGAGGFFLGVAITLGVTLIAVAALRDHIPPLQR
jgi:AAHS family 4-hydroxybenzoate transporter-like MFS transporter